VTVDNIAPGLDRWRCADVSGKDDYGGTFPSWNKNDAGFDVQSLWVKPDVRISKDIVLCAIPYVVGGLGRGVPVVKRDAWHDVQTPTPETRPCIIGCKNLSKCCSMTAVFE